MVRIRILRSQFQNSYYQLQVRESLGGNQGQVEETITLTWKDLNKLQDRLTKFCRMEATKREKSHV